MTFEELRDALRDKREYVGTRVFVEDTRGELHEIVSVETEILNTGTIGEVITVLHVNPEVADV